MRNLLLLFAILFYNLLYAGCYMLSLVLTPLANTKIPDLPER